MQEEDPNIDEEKELRQTNVYRFQETKRKSMEDQLPNAYYRRFDSKKKVYGFMTPERQYAYNKLPF